MILVIFTTVLLAACATPTEKKSHDDDRSQGDRSTVKTGDAVFAQWSDGHFYPAKITGVSGTSVSVYFPDGYNYTVGPGQFILNRYKYTVGEKVVSMWTNKGWYPGKIAEIKGNQYHIFYDDGDRLWVEHGWIVPRDIYDGRLR